jgi:hypothetical protein
MSRLDWPPGQARTPAHERSRNNSYQASLTDTTADIATEMDRLDPDEWQVQTASGGRYVKDNGLPKHNANPEDPGVVLRWSKGGRSYAVACDDSPRLRDNLRTVYLWVHETRMRSQRPVVTAQDDFAAAALPSGDEDAEPARPPAHEVLEVSPGAPDQVVRAAFKAQVTDAHPDHGGSPEAVRRLKWARDSMLGDDA